jgi:hypothetical protein
LHYAAAATFSKKWLLQGWQIQECLYLLFTAELLSDYYVLLSLNPAVCVEMVSLFAFGLSVKLMQKALELLFPHTHTPPTTF